MENFTERTKKGSLKLDIFKTSSPFSRVQVRNMSNLFVALSSEPLPKASGLFENKLTKLLVRTLDNFHRKTEIIQ